MTVPAEALRFLGPNDWYVEKEFKVAALVSRSLGKTNYYIGDNYNNRIGVIMTNAQMQSNFGVTGSNSAGLTLSEKADPEKAADEARRCTTGIPNCLLKSYTAIIEQQNLFLKQKMFFFYGIALILLLISLLHILNSIQYLVAARKHEFGILRAMGITDSGFRKMLLKEGLRYGVYSGIFMILLYLVVQKILYYAMVHVFLYLHPGTSLSILPILLMSGLNLLICLGAVLYSGREILLENIIDEIRR